MKKIVLYGILIFLVSMGAGFFYSKMWVNQKLADANLQVTGNTIGFINESENEFMKKEVEQTASTEEKISPNCEFALKKYYNGCSHFEFDYAELPKEIVNFTKEELEDYYEDWEVEEFSSNRVVLVKEISSLCNEHFIIKLGEKYIQIYHLEADGNLTLYKTTDISREYLTKEDITELEKGFYVFGEGKLNSVIEDFE